MVRTDVTKHRVLGVCVVIALGLAACGGDDDDGDAHLQRQQRDQQGDGGGHDLAGDGAPVGEANQPRGRDVVAKSRHLREVWFRALHTKKTQRFHAGCRWKQTFFDEAVFDRCERALHIGGKPEAA